MSGIISNAAALAATYQERRARLAAALRNGLRQWAARVDREQVLNLSGAGAPGAYPVPVRTGNLRGGHFFDVVDGALAVVGNTTEYAIAIHDGASYRREAREQSLYYSRNKATGALGNRFVKRKRAGFEQRTTIGAHDVAFAGRPFLGDAAAKVDGGAIMAVAVRGAL